MYDPMFLPPHPWPHPQASEAAKGALHVASDGVHAVQASTKSALTGVSVADIA